MITTMIPTKTKKLGRNDICDCGSGKKYKKCCLIKEQKVRKVGYGTAKSMLEVVEKFSNEQEQIEDMISREDIKPEEFKNAYDVKWIKRNENIPSEIKNQVDDFIESQPLRTQHCWYNAQAVTEKISSVDKIDGWYGFKEVDRINKLVERWGWNEDTDNLDRYGIFTGIMATQIGNLEKMGNGFYKLIRDGKGNCSVILYDFYNKMVWYRHSWNSYKGQHFDLTKNLNSKYSNKWIEYKAHPYSMKITKENVKTSNRNLPVGQITQSILDANLLIDTEYDNYEVLNQNHVGEITNVNKVFRHDD